MSRPMLRTVARYAADLAAEADAARPDADLLRRFTDGDGQAFAALVRRHGPMVWGVCRQLLPNPADAEDAFQATFLALVRSARKLSASPALGGWLHAVAVRAAKRVRRDAFRRNARESNAARPEAGRPVPDSAWDDLLAAVHSEVQRLPEGLRTAFVLCDLEGVTQADAAARLGWKPGTLTGRLSKARQRLLDRLTRQGFVPAAAAAIGVTAVGAAVPPALVGRVITLAAAPHGASAAVSALVLEVTAMTWNRTKLIAAVLMAAGGLGAGVGSGWVANAGAQAIPQAGTPPPLPAANAPDAGLPTRPVPGSGTGGVMREPSLPAPSAPRAWDYRYVSRTGGTVDFIKALESQAGEGWEYVETFNARPDEMEDLAKLALAKPEQFRLDRDSVGVALFRRPRRLGSVVSRPAADGQNPESGLMMRGSGPDPLYQTTPPAGGRGMRGSPPFGGPPVVDGGDSGFSGKADDFRSRNAADDFVIETVELTHIGQAGLSENIKQLLTGSQLSRVNVIPSPAGNGLILSGNTAAVQKVQKVILSLDVPPKVKRSERGNPGSGSTDPYQSK